MDGSESNEERRERGKGREEEDRGRKVITWLEERAMKKAKIEERGERRKKERKVITWLEVRAMKK